MSQNTKKRARILSFLLSFLGVLPGVADSVTRDTAFQVASSQLPSFYPGTWRLSDEYAMENLSGETLAYTFIFAKTDAQTAKTAEFRTLAPTSFVARARLRLKEGGQSVTGNSPELYGETLFASIIISAKDTEPPVLRCFQGLPVHVVKEEDALALVAKERGAGAWRVSRRLMLGLFDEAFCLENADDASAAQVVDMRSGSVVTKADAQGRSRMKKHGIADDAERVRLCKAAWQTAVAQSKKSAADVQPDPANARQKVSNGKAPSLPLRRTSVVDH